MRAELAAIEDQHSSCSHHASISSWIRKADRINKEFFSTFKKRSTSYVGVLQSDPNTVLALSIEYFDALFTAEIETKESRVARDMVWSHIHPSVSQEMASTILAPFSELEI